MYTIFENIAIEQVHIDIKTKRSVVYLAHIFTRITTNIGKCCV